MLIRAQQKGNMTTAACGGGGALEREVQRDHVIIFPFMAKGHTIPLLHLAAALSTRGLHVTLITTPANVPFITSHLTPAGSHPLVAVLTIPFPHLPPLPPGVESTDSLPSFDLYTTFLQATALLRDDFHRLLLQLVSTAPPPLCLISDFFLGWTLPICRQVGLPRLVFHGMSAFAMGLCKALWLHQTFAGAGEETFHVPGAPPSLLLTQSDVPEDIRSSTDQDNQATQILTQTAAWDVESYGVVVNSFAELESEFIGLLESFYRQGGARSWLVGPLRLLGGNDAEKYDPEGCLQWLDGRAARSTVFVSFGTQAQVTDDQLDEVAHGLKQSGYDFLWVVRSKTWTPPPPKNLGPKGKIVTTWIPQMEVLRHVAIGAFLSHCGWNSVLESFCAGVPIICWPMIAEQTLNAKHVSEVLCAGVRLRSESDMVVGREEVAEGVREVMGDGLSGRRARKRAAELRVAAEEAVDDGGSSRAALDDLLLKLREVNAGKGLNSPNVAAEVD